MKNLRVLEHRYLDLLSAKDNPSSSSLILSEADSLCCLSNDSGNFYVYKEGKVHCLTSPGLSFHLGNENAVNSKIIGFEYCDITCKIYIAYACGQLYTLEPDIPDSIAEFEAQFSEGLQVMTFSPDLEIVTLVTANETVILMTSSCHILTEVNLNSRDFGEKQFVTVGWGRKETQFHGSEGKSAAKAKPSSIEKSESDDGLPRISWRGDGTLFAVSFLSKETNIRQFKVFDRKGVLQFTSEPCTGLEQNLAWKPSGNLIATTQRFPNKHVVSLFEKNGLKHREFTLPFEPKEILVKDLQWSSDSDVLAIWCITINDDTNFVQLWSENNYHWYLKQTILFSTDNPPLYLAWTADPKLGKTLVILTKVNYLTYTFYWTINHSSGRTEDDKALVGVIDGDRALLTGFRVGVVPPPMAHQALQIDQPINEVVFGPETKDKDSWINTNVLFAVLHNNQLAFYKQVPNFVEYGHIKSYEIEWEVSNPISSSAPNFMHHFLWYKEDSILCAATLGTNSLLCVIQMDGISPAKNGRLIVRDTYRMNGTIQHIVGSPNPDVVYIMMDRVVYTYSKEKGVNQTEISVNATCHQMNVIEIEKKHVVLCLSDRYCLYVNGKEIANNITSLFVHSEFLLLTTLQHTLVSITLDGSGFEKLLTQDLTVKPWEGADNEKFISGLSIRRLERGSKLITAVSKDTRTILQMPRGNLECIQPRALSLYVIGRYLNELNYYSAFDLMRKQRINLNLLVDHDPNLFISNADKFIDDIKNPNWLSLFLSDLREEDVTTTMYSSCYRQKTQDGKSSNQIPGSGDNSQNSSSKSVSVIPEKGKIENICELLRNHMEGRPDTDRLLLPILTSLVKKQEIKDLEAALVKVKTIRNLENENENEKQFRSSSEEALKYLLYLVDVNTLFDIALGMYDFELVMIVAAKSQKDPKEYVPFLNNLRQMDENYMRYSIDVHLKRFEKALNHISKCNERFNECITFVKTQKLFSQALKLFPINSKEYKDISEIYGEYLIDARKFQEAAIMFTRSNCLAKALNTFTLAGDWREAIVVAKQMKSSVAELHNLCEVLVAKLKEGRRYAEAAIILTQELCNFEDGIATLCEGKLWQDALRVAYQVDRLDIIETHIKPGVSEHADYLISKINENRQDFTKHKQRLKIVREEKLLRESQSLYNTEGDYDPSAARGESDLFSDTTSIAGSITSRGSQSSRTSGRSYRSSKNRRKHERKLHSLREGSIYEDMALIAALHGIVTSAYAYRAEVNILAKMLLRFYNDTRAEKLQNLLDEFLNEIERGKADIWIDNPSNNTSNLISGKYNEVSQSVQEGSTPEVSLAPHLRYPPTANPIIWKLEMLSLQT
ncbi:putative elongator complex protein 1 [Athalia rosae]|uniref:putative elongator complex protein 1 n=1 Tax=Athalia rosae TaxID=37344 RepID=UPI0020338E4E|nr:putative elongator complex protein 1 [Athalia rosae]